MARNHDTPHRPRVHVVGLMMANWRRRHQRHVSLPRLDLDLLHRGRDSEHCIEDRPHSRSIYVLTVDHLLSRGGRKRDSRRSPC